MKTNRFTSSRATQMVGFVLLCCGMTSHGQVSNYVDAFTAGPLDPGWNIINPSNHVGYTGTGLYEMELDATLQRPPGATNEDWTADVTFEMGGTLFQNVDYKFRFLAPAFLEVVANPQADTIRVFSGELGMGIGIVSETLGDGSVVNLRVSYDASEGAVKVAYSLGSDPLTLLASASGLTSFQVGNIDININKISGPGVATPAILIDRFEIRDEVVAINFDTFEDPFDGPILDPSWTLIQPADHAGFIGGGLYEVAKTNTTGEAGLSRPFGGQADFVSTVAFRMQDFVGSDAQVEFRNPSPGGGITVVLDSAGDVRVESEELGTTVANLAGFSYQDGETLEFMITTDSVNELTEVGLRRNGGSWLRLASLEGLNLFAPAGNEIVLIKNGTGNGNTPRLQLDRYYLEEGFAAVPFAPFAEVFTGPALDSSWFTSDTGTGTLVGFNRRGQYEIRPLAGVTGGLSRFVDFSGDATFTLTARLVDFVGTDTELQFALTGGDALTVILRSDDSLEIVSDEFGSVFSQSGLGLSDGDLVTMQVTIETEFGDWEFGLGINAEPGFLAGDVGYADLNPTATEIVVARGGGGSGTQPSILLDQTSINQGFAFIPQAATAFSDDFNMGPLAWNTVGITHVGYTNSQWYAIRVDTNVDVNINRLLAPGGEAGIPVGSFSAFLDVQFDEFHGTGNPGAGTDFKYKIEGGNLMEIVFNSFKTVRFFTQDNGASWFQSTLTEFQDGDTVNFGIVYDAAGPSVTMSVGLNGTNILTETQSNLVGVAPSFIKINGFRFNYVNPDLDPTFLIDQLDITPGLAEVDPGRIALQPAYDGLQQLAWGLGTLQSAPDVDGTYSNVMWATSPYLLEPSEEREFLRVEN